MADVARALAYERYCSQGVPFMLHTCRSILKCNLPFRCDRQEQALDIVTAVIAGSFSSLPSNCKQEALACMHRSPTLIPSTLILFSATAFRFCSCTFRLRAAIGPSSSICFSTPIKSGDDDPLRSLPAVHAGALSHANQVAQARGMSRMRFSTGTIRLPPDLLFPLQPSGAASGGRHNRISVPLHPPSGPRATSAALGDTIKPCLQNFLPAIQCNHTSRRSTSLV
jgi:hypothetical protein